jgi:hypothetical protein
MTDRLISDDLINAIESLRNFHNKKYDGNKEQENVRNPIIDKIRPEWHFSESLRIFENIDINWDNLGRSEIISDAVKNLYNVNTDIFTDEFERSSSGWYQAYHFIPRTKWGIHIRYDSWIRIAARFNHDCPSLISKDIDSVKAAFLYLFNHVLFHYMTENSASVMEILLDNPYIYTKYYSKIYIPMMFNSDQCLEESLSNRYLFERSEDCHIDKYYLKEELSKQHRAYGKFVEYLGSNFLDGIRTLLLQVKDGILNPVSKDPIEQIMDISNRMDYSHGHRIPIWLHRRARPLH